MLQFLTIALILSVILYPLFKIIAKGTSKCYIDESSSEKYLREIRDYERIKFLRDLDGK